MPRSTFKDDYAYRSEEKETLFQKASADPESLDRPQPLSSSPAESNTAAAASKSIQRRKLIALALIVTLIVSFFSYPSSCLHRAARQYSSFMSSSATSPLDGWHIRASLHPSPESFKPDLKNLRFGLRSSTQVNPNGLVTALFSPDYTVDAAGRVLKLASEDQEALDRLAQSAADDSVPRAGGFRNQWRIKHRATCRSIHILEVKKQDRFDTVSVYGLEKGLTTLDPPVGDITEIPDILQKAFLTLKEGSNQDRSDDSEGDVELAKRVAGVVASAED